MTDTPNNLIAFLANNKPEQSIDEALNRVAIQSKINARKIATLAEKIARLEYKVNTGWEKLGQNTRPQHAIALYELTLCQGERIV